MNTRIMILSMFALLSTSLAFANDYATRVEAKRAECDRLESSANEISFGDTFFNTDAKQDKYKRQLRVTYCKIDLKRMEENLSEMPKNLSTNNPAQAITFAPNPPEKIENPVVADSDKKKSEESDSKNAEHKADASHLDEHEYEHDTHDDGDGF